MRPRPYVPARRLLACLALAAALLGIAACSHSSAPVGDTELAFDGDSYRVVRIDLHHRTLRLMWRDPATGQPFGTIENLRQWAMANNRRLVFAANAGIYDRHYAPLGLYVEDGRTLVPLNKAHGNPAAGNFSLRPNGVFAIYPDGHAAVRTSEAFDADAKPVRWASQSGPMLVIDGRINPAFDDDSDSLKWRSGVCARTPYEVIFAISESPVNFHAFAKLFRDRLGCRDALFLDGSISQFYDDGDGYAGAPTFMVKPYAGIFAVFDNP